MDRTHNPEFTAMEIYVAYKDYNWMMDFTEKLLEFCAVQVNGSAESTFGEHTINWKAPYPRVSMTEAIQKYTGFDITGKTEQELFDFAKSIGIDVNETMGKGKLIDEIFGEKCEGNFIQPTFITDYPIEMSPLTKKHRSKEGLTERFELMVCGKEIANAYSELNDPIDQRERFESQMALSERGDDEAMFIDQDFLRALEYGMPPTSGLGIGMDRLIMFLTNNASIQEVLFFPQMRPEKTVPQIELGEDEKVILEILNSQEEPFTLAEVKERSQLSGKKWDKASKTLTKNNLVKVDKIDDQLLMKLI
jgi:lysyl-tRNA synthetase class 2